MNDFSIGAMKARNIAAQFGVFEKAQNAEISSEETAEEVVKARNVGDIHPNGKWVWTEYKPGRFDWRPLKGRGGVDRIPKKGDEGAAAKKEDESGKKTAAAQATPSSGEKRVMSAIQTFSSKYTNKNLVELEKTPKGNWDVRYDGHRLGIINGDQITEAEARAAGFLPPEKAKQSGKSLPEPNEGEKWEDFAERYEKAYRKANPDTSRKNSDIRSDASKAWDKTHASGKKIATVDDHAKKTPTKTLENAAKSDKAPGSIKGAAEAELKARKDAEIAKKLNLHSKGELATALTKIASEWDSYNDSEKTIIKQSISQARKHIIEEIEGGNFSTETMSYLADLQSIENYIKKTDSEPKPVGDIIKNLMSDLKAKTVADTTSGQEKIKNTAKRIKSLSLGDNLNFSSNGKNISVRKDREFDDGYSAFTIYVDGVGMYSGTDSETVAKRLNTLFPDAKEVKSSEKKQEESEEYKAFRNAFDKGERSVQDGAKDWFLDAGKYGWIHLEKTWTDDDYVDAFTGKKMKGGEAWQVHLIVKDGSKKVALADPEERGMVFTSSKERGIEAAKNMMKEYYKNPEEGMKSYEHKKYAENVQNYINEGITSSSEEIEDVLKTLDENKIKHSSFFAPSSMQGNDFAKQRWVQEKVRTISQKIFGDKVSGHTDSYRNDFENTLLNIMSIDNGIA